MPAPDAPEALRRFGRNILASLSYQVAGIAFSFVALPIVIRGLGADAYGLWNVVSSLYAVIGVTELMLSGTAVRFIAEAHGRGDHRQTRELYDVLWRVAVGWGVVAAVALGLGARWLITTIFHFSAAQADLAVFVLWCQAAVLPFRMALTIDAGAIQAYQRFDLSSGIGIGSVAAHGLGLVVIVSAGGGLRAVVLWEALAVVMSEAAHVIVARRLVPPCAGRPAARRWAGILLPFAGNIVVGYAASSLLVPASRLLLGMFRPLAEVAYFSLAVKLASEARACAGHIASAATPAASDLVGRADRASLSLVFAQACRWSLLTLVPIGVMAATLGGRFVTYWVNPEFGAACDSILPVLVPGLCVVFLGVVPDAIARGLGRAGPWAATNLAALGLVMLGGWWLIPRHGAVGAAWAMTAASVIAVGVFLAWMIRQLSLSADLLRRACPPRLFGLGGALFVATWLGHPFLQNLHAVLLASAVAAVAFVVALIALVFTPEERQMCSRLFSWGGRRSAAERRAG